MINRAEREWAIEFLSDRENSIQSLLSYRAGDWADKALEEIRALKIAIKALQQPPADQWILCSIAVPPRYDTDILIKCESGETFRGFYDYFKKAWYCIGDDSCERLENAVEWKLQEPYKGVE